MRRALVFVLILCLLGLLTGCGEASLTARGGGAEPEDAAKPAEASAASTPRPTPQPTPRPTPQPGQGAGSGGDKNTNGDRSDARDYVLNTNTMKFHYPSCSSVKDIKEKNRWDYTGAREEILEMGYVPCKKCNP